MLTIDEVGIITPYHKQVRTVCLFVYYHMSCASGYHSLSGGEDSVTTTKNRTRGHKGDYVNATYYSTCQYFNNQHPQYLNQQKELILLCL